MANKKKLLRGLAPLLDPEEKMHVGVLGAYTGSLLGQEALRSGIAVATDTRLVLYGKKMFGYQLEVFPYEKIASIQMSKDWWGHNVTFISSGNRIEVKHIKKGNTEKLVSFVRSRIDGKKAPRSPGPEGDREALGTSAEDRMRSLESLRTKGMLTEQEYSQKRTEILRSI